MGIARAPSDAHPELATDPLANPSDSAVRYPDAVAYLKLRRH
jgi:hypothetical protein